MKTSMAVTVTIVFSCESHREAWLEQQGIVPNVVVPERNADGSVTLPDNRAQAHAIAQRMDYEKRRLNTNLVYILDEAIAKRRGVLTG